MPIALPLATVIGGGLAGGGMASAGKKGARGAKDAAAQQAAVQREQLALSKEQLALGKTAFLPARDYWTALMQGGQPARDAVGPMAAEVKAGHEAGRRSIEQDLPRGGERNLAVAQAHTAENRDAARLYAGVQPLAAQNLAQLAGIASGTGAGIFPPAQIGASLGFQQGQQALLAQGASGIGRFLYNAFQSKPGSGPKPGQLQNLPIAGRNPLDRLGIPVGTTGISPPGGG